MNPISAIRGIFADLLALPVPRYKVVLAKMIAILAWCVVLVLFVFTLGLGLGYLLNLPGWSWPSLLSALHTISVTSILAILLCTPVTWMASLSRGYLAPLAFVILSIVLAQIIGALGFGIYFPWAVPAIYSNMIGAQSILTLTSYLVLVMTSMAGLAGTFYWWSFADHTR